MKKLLWLSIMVSFVAVNFAAATSLEKLEKKASKLFDAKKHERSITVYRKIVDKYPDSDAAPKALMMIGVNYDWLAAKNQDPSMIEKAKEAFTSSADRYPDSSVAAEAYLYLGQMYGGFTSVVLKSSDCAKAMEMFEKAIQKASKPWISAQAKGRIGQCFDLANEKEKSKAAYGEVIQNYPDTPWAKEALKLLGIKPESQELSEAAYALLTANKYEPAIGAFARVIERAPSSSEAQDAQMMIGIVYGNMGKHDKAIEAYETYFKNYTPYLGDSTYYYMGTALARAGRTKEAKEAFLRVIADERSQGWAVKSSKDGLKKLGDK